MDTQIQHNPATIKTYFEKVRQLQTSGEQFPVSLDDVWPLVYSRKDKAVRALKENFFENEDFVLLPQNGQQKSGRGGHNETVYHLSVACLEFFIARKVRAVFEVYRQVFHKAVEAKSMSPAELAVYHAQLILDQERRVSSLEKTVGELQRVRDDATQLLLEAPRSEEQIPEERTRDKVRRIVNQYVRATGVDVQTVWNAIYDKLYYSYHVSIKAYRKEKGESWLDVAERNGHIDKIYAIASNILTIEKQY